MSRGCLGSHRVIHTQISLNPSPVDFSSLLLLRFPAPSPTKQQITNEPWDEQAPPELQGLQPNFTNIQLHRLHEATYKYEDNRMLSMNNSQLLFHLKMLS